MKKLIRIFNRYHLGLIGLSAILIVVTVQITGLMLGGGSDLSIHLTNANKIQQIPLQSWLRSIGHPLWHSLVMLLHCLGIPLNQAGVILFTFTKVLSMLMIYWFYQRVLKDVINPFWIPFLAFITVIVAALRVPSINPNVYLYGGSPNPWHSPTQLMVAVWMLPCVYFLTHSYDRQLLAGHGCTLSWTKVIVFSAMLVMSLLAKPVFVQCFFPGAAIYFLYQWIKKPEFTRYFVRLLISLLPTIPIILFQLNSYFGAESASGMRMMFDPYRLKIELRAALLINAFPIFALLCTIGKHKGSTIPIVVLTTVVAFAENCFLGETGPRAADGNWGWAILAASFLLWIVAIPEYVKALKEKRSWKTILFSVVGTCLLMWHFLSGMYYVHYLLTSGRWF